MSSPRSHQLPSTKVASAFGEVNVTDSASGRQVRLTILMEPVDEEGWQTGVALDGSATMKGWYGKALSGKVPPEIAEQYLEKGWIVRRVQDGKSLQIYQKQAYDDAIQRGYLKMTENIVQPTAREFITYLAEKLDADGGTTVIYWACGNGAELEEIGDFTADQCKSIVLSGPTAVPFGNGTHLLPALQYFASRFQDAQNGMYVFLTDGRLDDLEDVKQFTHTLAQEIQGGARRPMKCVLVGIGNAVDESQMEELDDLDTGTSVDVWDHKIARDMRDIREIFAEVVSENTIVASTARILDHAGKVAASFSDGLPALVEFTLPPNCPWFDLEVEGQCIRQTLE